MKTYWDINSINIKNPAVTVGTFDGVHLGHQYIFRQLINSATSNHTESMVITFWPHPRMIVNKGATEIMMLNTLEEKIDLIGRQGVQHFLILPFNQEFSQLSAAQFIEKYLFQKLHIKSLIMGYDHRFGKDRMGDFDHLKNCAEKYNFNIQQVEPFCLEGEKISSTIIRDALLNGKVDYANKFLSRNYSVTGNVKNGKKIGRDLGFPTANIHPDYNYKLIPHDGVYAVKVIVDGKEFIGMLNIGIRPTVNKGNENKSIEVHLIDFEGDLYDKKISLVFYKKIRNEMKFNSLDQLINQLKADKIQISNYFKR
jgi:riboflavin kinase/FMN adenylyltransferase